MQEVDSLNEDWDWVRGENLRHLERDQPKGWNSSAARCQPASGHLHNISALDSLVNISLARAIILHLGLQI